MEQSISIKHHYVPQVYLRNWASHNNKKKIFEFKRLVSNKRLPLWEEKSISKTGFIKYLYTEHTNGIDNDVFEKWFDKNIENSLHNIFAKIINDETISNIDHQNLIKFISSQYLRTIPFYLKHKSITDNIFETVLSSISFRPNHLKNKADCDNSLPLKGSILNIEENGKTGLKVETLVGRKSWINHIKRLFPLLTDILLKNKWSILKAEGDLEFPTSDDPVICLRYIDKKNYSFDAGPKTKGTFIICPLSPKHVLFTQVGNKKLNYNNNENKTFSEFIRKIIVEHSFMYVYAKDRKKLKNMYPYRDVNKEEYLRIHNELKTWHAQKTLEQEYEGN